MHAYLRRFCLESLNIAKNPNNCVKFQILTRLFHWEGDSTKYETPMKYPLNDGVITCYIQYLNNSYTDVVSIVGGYMPRECSSNYTRLSSN